MQQSKSNRLLERHDRIRVALVFNMESIDLHELGMNQAIDVFCSQQETLLSTASVLPEGDNRSASEGEAMN